MKTCAPNSSFARPSAAHGGGRRRPKAKTPPPPRARAGAVAGGVAGADAYQLYRGLDIGTAKVSRELRRRVPHHLIDIVDPDEPLTLARYLDAAQAPLADVWSRGKLPILAGGSGQYFWALLEGWQVPRVPPDAGLRREMEALAETEGAVAVHARLAALDAEAGRRPDANNPRPGLRALALPREELYRRLDARTDAMFAAGFVDEVRRLRAAGFADCHALRSGVGYKEGSLYLDGAFDYDEAGRRR